jgi:hypothetical protein
MVIEAVILNSQFRSYLGWSLKLFASDSDYREKYTFNPPLAGMVVETSLGIRGLVEYTPFNPPLAGMVVETLPT